MSRAPRGVSAPGAPNRRLCHRRAIGVGTRPDADHRTRERPRDHRAARHYFFAATFFTETATAAVCVKTTISPTETLSRFSLWIGVTRNSWPS